MNHVFTCTVSNSDDMCGHWRWRRIPWRHTSSKWLWQEGLGNSLHASTFSYSIHLQVTSLRFSAPTFALDANVSFSYFITSICFLACLCMTHCQDIFLYLRSGCDFSACLSAPIFPSWRCFCWPSLVIYFHVSPWNSTKIGRMSCRKPWWNQSPPRS